LPIFRTLPRFRELDSRCPGASPGGCLGAGRVAMRGFCAKCGRTFGEQMLCPLCGIQLETDGAPGGGVPLSVPFTDETPDGPSFLRRLAFGLICLLGLYQGLKHLALAGVLVQTGTAVLSADSHLSLLITATLAASIVAGTVNRRAEATGLLLAAAAAGGFLGPDLWWGGELPDEWLIGVPTTIALVGVIGGFAGRLMVPPAPNLPSFGRLESRVVVQVQRKPVRIGWPQVAFGAGIAVGGAVFAEEIRQTLSVVLAGGGGAFGARSLIAWQVSTLAALVGGVAAGFSSRAAFRQALMAGLGAGAGAVFCLATRQATNTSPVVDFWIDQVNVKDNPLLPFAAIGLSTCLATALGGWLGSHVFPPSPRK
jgi:hypothetical protein